MFPAVAGGLVICFDAIKRDLGHGLGGIVARGITVANGAVLFVLSVIELPVLASRVTILPGPDEF